MYIFFKLTAIQVGNFKGAHLVLCTKKSALYKT